MRYWIGPKILFFALILTSCSLQQQKGSQDPQANIAKLDEVIRDKNTDIRSIPLMVYLDLRDAFSFNIQDEKSSGQDIEYTLNCSDMRCESAIKIDGRGNLNWNGSLFQPNERSHIDASIDLRKKGDTAIISSRSLSFEVDNYPFQGGDSWGAVEYSNEPELLRAAQITGSDFDIDSVFSGASVIYLGKFGSEHLVATAKHVFYSKKSGGEVLCNKERKFLFGILNITATCKDIVWVSEKYDFVVLAVEGEGLAKMENESICMSTKEDSLAVGHHLALGGFGRYRNPYGRLLFSSDEDCRILSNKSLNLSSDFSNLDKSLKNSSASYAVAACDGSPGFSGGPVFDKDAGSLLGMIVGSNPYIKIRPKSEDIQNALANKENDPTLIGNVVYLPFQDVWNEIRDALNRKLTSDPSLKDLINGNSVCKHI